MSWLYLILGGFLEIGWSYYLNESQGFTKLFPSVMAIVLVAFSFMLLEKAMKELGIGVSYAVFTGIGTAGIALIGMLFLGESVSVGKIFFLCLLLVGMVGLKMSESGKEGSEK